MSVTGWSRSELAAEVTRLRAEGLFHREVAARLGISRSYAQELCVDPTGKRARARKDSYAQQCVDCGAATSGSEGRRDEPRCLRCASIRSGAAKTVWTADRIIAAIQWWNERYGEPPAMKDWNPNLTDYLGDSDRAARARQHIAAGAIPWSPSAVRVFGSWNSAIRAAGFEPRAPHGGGGNALRTRRARSRAAA